MNTINVNDKDYVIIKDVHEAIDIESLSSLVTDYFDDFDYIVGDWAYGKLRLKGFYESTNPKRNKNNDIAFLDSYIEKKCAYGCKWFEIKKND